MIIIGGNNQAIENATKHFKNEYQWGEPEYVWSADYSTVTASRICEDILNLIEQETVGTTVIATGAAICLESGS